MVACVCARVNVVRVGCVCVDRGLGVCLCLYVRWCACVLLCDSVCVRWLFVRVTVYIVCWLVVWTRACCVWSVVGVLCSVCECMCGCIVVVCVDGGLCCVSG